MKASIISVGTELLFGQTINSNAAFLSKELNLMGFNVLYHFTVGDNKDRLIKTIERAIEENDLLIFTGGLGPTEDDITKEVVSEYFGAKLEQDEKSYTDMLDFFMTKDRIMTPNNIKQTYMPAESTIFHNGAGTAPGFCIHKNGKYAICFPGPPRELKFMFENGVKEYLKKISDQKMYYKILKTVGIGESELETLLLPLIHGQTDPTIATYAKAGECAIRIASMNKEKETAIKKVNDMILKIRNIVGEYIYGYDDEDLKAVVVKKLIDKNLKITACESATGGMFLKSITDIQGSSKTLEEGFVTYSNISKERLVGVKEETITNYGVVSAEVAKEMAEGAKNNAKSDISISITGYAGPEEDEEKRGVAYIGYKYKDNLGAVKVATGSNDRDFNRTIFVLKMFQTVNNLID